MIISLRSIRVNSREGYIGQLDGRHLQEARLLRIFLPVMDVSGDVRFAG